MDHNRGSRKNVRLYSQLVYDKGGKNIQWGKDSLLINWCWKNYKKNLDSVLKSRGITLMAKIHIAKAVVFLVVMYGCESWTINKESWVPKNWCIWTVVLEKALEGSQPVHPKGNQYWILIGRTDVEAETLILWLPDVKNWLIRKDPDAGKDGRQEEKGMTENEMVGWHHRLDGYEFE